MNDKEFINNLSATYADVRRLDAKKINLKGKNILDYIKESTPAVKHSQDTRETVTENDLWGQWVETLEDGTIIVHDDWIVNPNASDEYAWNESITKVEDNKAYIDDSLFANIQTEKIKNGNRMFVCCPNLTSFSSDLSSLTDVEYMFCDCLNLASFSSNLSSLTRGDSMFSGCSNLISFFSHLSNLTDGKYMFTGCSQLPSFSSDLSSLIDGRHMFKFCSGLTSFSSDLPSLMDAECMFYECPNLTSFSSDLPNLTNGRDMFYECENLTTFSLDLPSLMNGHSMFRGCTNLTSFSSDLSNLTSGYMMFDGCSLDAESVMCIADIIKDIAAEKQLYSNGTIPYVTRNSSIKGYSAPKGFESNGNYVYSYNNPNLYFTTIQAAYVGNLTLGINVSNNADTIQQQLEDFAKAATFDTWSDLKTHFSNKGWTVTFQYGGTTDTIPDTYDLRGGEHIIPCSIFAKLVEADKDSAEYCTEDASSFYNIEWGHDVTDTSSYTQFDSLEDAMASWNVFPKENIITSEE